MLDFIVLGIVPGTSFVITLWWALLFALLAAIASLVYVEIRKFSKRKSLILDNTEVTLETSSLSELLTPIFRFRGRNLLLDHHHEEEQTS